jgi:hypothetical protein
VVAVTVAAPTAPLVHAATAAMRLLSKNDTSPGEWLRRMLVRGHGNVVLVALANELARVVRAPGGATEALKLDVCLGFDCVV